MDQREATVRWAVKHWQLIITLLTMGISIGVAKQTFRGLTERVEAIDATDPYATSALTKRNADDNAAIRLKIDSIEREVWETRADVAALCGAAGIKPAKVAMAPAATDTSHP